MALSGRRARRPRGSLLATFSLLSVLVAITAPGVAFAGEGQVKLALTPVDQRGSFFDLVMRPGESRHLKVDVSNAGRTAVLARTYAADVYTIINGGFGARLREEPQTGTTGWLDYQTEVTEISVGQSTRRSFTVAVPSDTRPGEYITSVVLENERPIRDDGAVGLDQIVRQAVAVVVTVSGPRSPVLVIGDAAHTIVAGRSVIRIAVENAGNVRLKPVVDFWLIDDSGSEVSRASVPMDTFYAHTDTFVEVQLAALLRPGTYSVRLTLDDAARDARAEAAAISLVVGAPAETGAGTGAVPGLTEVVQGGDASPLAPTSWGLIFLAGLVLGCVAIGLIALTMRRRRTSTPAR
jgi:hypothetical protein